MHRLLKKLQENKMCLISSIPQNTYEMAKASWEAGADAVKVHINVLHHASQNLFGTLDSMRDVLEKILKDSPVPVGIVIGQDTFVCESVVDEVVKMGFDFISLYGHHTPASLFMRKDISKFFAISNEYDYEEIAFVIKSPKIDMLELSICDPNTYGERLNARDLMKYEMISKEAIMPTIVPTQRVVYPSDVKALYEAHVKAIMVGTISFGKTPETIYKTLKAFREEIDKL